MSVEPCWFLRLNGIALACKLVDPICLRSQKELVVELVVPVPPETVSNKKVATQQAVRDPAQACIQNAASLSKPGGIRRGRCFHAANF